MNNLTLSWAAGFFDGEGCISFARRKRKKNWEYELSLTIGQASITPLKKFQKMFGGKLRKDVAGYYRWTCNYREALDTLKQIKPYMILKRKEAELALLYENLYLGKGPNITENLLIKRDRLYKAIKKEKLKYKKQLNFIGD